MVEAIEAGEALGEYYFDYEWTNDVQDILLSLEQKIAKLFNGTDKGYYSSTINEANFSTEVKKAVSDPKVANLVIAKLKEKGLGDYEKYLGRGAFGKVFQLEGHGEFEGKKLALKLLPCFSNDQYTTFWSQSNTITEEGAQGDALALNLPKEHHLLRAYALLTYDGNQVHYIEKIDPKIHKGHTVVGILSRAIEGGTLGERIHKLPMNAEAVRGYGKQLAEAIHGLHKVGYAHGDLHTGNILVHKEKAGKSSYRLKLADFGLTHKLADSPSSGEWDWKHYGIILDRMAQNCEIKDDPILQDLLTALSSEQMPNEEAIIHHPFFA